MMLDYNKDVVPPVEVMEMKMTAYDVVDNITDADVDKYKALSKADPTMSQIIASAIQSVTTNYGIDNVCNTLTHLAIAFWLIGKKPAKEQAPLPPMELNYDKQDRIDEWFKQYKAWRNA